MCVYVWGRRIYYSHLSSPSLQCFFLVVMFFCLQCLVDNFRAKFTVELASCSYVCALQCVDFEIIHTAAGE